MSKRRTRLPTEPFTAFIEKLSHDGRGIARVEGKTTFIQGALPNETVSFQYLRQKSDFDEGKLLKVIEPSKDRVSPRCEHANICGGCSLQHLNSSLQISEKEQIFLELMKRIGNCSPKVLLQPLTADAWHYRNKARLSVRFVEKKQTALVGFREKNNPRYIAEIQHCPVLNKSVDAEIIYLRHLIDSFEDPRSIAQIEVAAGDDEVALIFRNLQPLSANDQQKIITFAEKTGFRIFLQPGGPDSVFLFYPMDSQEYLHYHLPSENISFSFHPTDFTQVNAKLNRLMVEQALTLLALDQNDIVLDLFCGLGNFSLPIAKRCANVVGVEGSDAMVARATMNAQKNSLSNTKFICANLEEETIVPKLASHAKFNKILLDPPRTGALSIVKELNKLNAKRIVYVSCNPATLARDANIIVNQHGYKLAAAGVMDMFPHTAHIESIALFEK